MTEQAHQGQPVQHKRSAIVSRCFKATLLSFSFFFFKVTPHSTRDLSYLTRD